MRLSNRRIRWSGVKTQRSCFERGKYLILTDEICLDLILNRDLTFKGCDERVTFDVGFPRHGENETTKVKK